MITRSRARQPARTQAGDRRSAASGRARPTSTIRPWTPASPLGRRSRRATCSTNRRSRACGNPCSATSALPWHPGRAWRPVRGCGCADTSRWDAGCRSGPARYLNPHVGFLWSARAAGLISGYDRYVDGAGAMTWNGSWAGCSRSCTEMVPMSAGARRGGAAARRSGSRPRWSRGSASDGRPMSSTASRPITHSVGPRSIFDSPSTRRARSSRSRSTAGAIPTRPAPGPGTHSGVRSLRTDRSRDSRSPAEDASAGTSVPTVGQTAGPSLRDHGPRHRVSARPRGRPVTEIDGSSVRPASSKTRAMLDPVPGDPAPDPMMAMAGVRLYWIPLGAGQHVVRASGRVFEALTAWAQRRRRCALYHSALAGARRPLRDRDDTYPRSPRRATRRRRHRTRRPQVGGTPPRVRYEIHGWRGGTIRDEAEAAATVDVSVDEACARRILDLVALVPTPT